MPESIPDRLAGSVAFLACLLSLPPEEAIRASITFQTFDDAKPDGKPRPHLAKTLHGSFKDLSPTLEAWNHEGAGVFVSVNVTDGKGRKKANITAWRGFWCDIDAKDAGRELDIPDLPLPPTMVVRTPGGAHLYWLTENPIPCPDDATRSVLEAQTRAIAQHLKEFGGDLKACDGARVLRVPGFLHQKKSPTHVALEQVDGPRYTRDQIGEAFPPLPPKEKQAMEAQPECLARPQNPAPKNPGKLQRMRAYALAHPPSISGKSGHQTLFNLALKLFSGFDASEDEVFLVLRDDFNPRCVPPWSEAELQHKAHDASLNATDRGRLLRESHDRRKAELVPSSHAVPSQPGLPAPNQPPHGPEIPGFEWSREGLFRVTHKFNEDGSPGRVEKVWIAPCFDLPGLIRDAASGGWKLLLGWNDLDGHRHEEPIPFEMISGEGADLGRLLSRGGLVLPPDLPRRKALLHYLSQAIPHIQGRILAVESTGWQDNGAFILQDGTVIGEGKERLRFAGAIPSNRFQGTNGTLEGWQQSIGRLANGNPFLMFAIACAFAPPLLAFVRPDGGGGFNLQGSSSKGKSTILEAAASVWGRPDPLITWRTTSNGLEGIAVSRNDGLLVLDEMSQVDSKEAGSIAYMVANGSAKVRATKEGTSRPLSSWRLMFLSSGEQGVEDKLSEDGKRIRAGQEVRVPDIPCPPEGMFHCSHEFPNMGAFAENVKSEARKNYGHPIRAFLRNISQEWERRESLTTRFREVEASWLGGTVPPRADGQVRRVAGRFGMVAVAGETAQRMGILPWEPGEATQAVSICFQAWLDRRGHIGASERERGLLAVVDFISMHGLSRFAEWENREAKPVNMAGVRKAAESGGIRLDSGWDFFLSPTGWKEACKGFNPRTVAKDAIEDGLLEPAPDGSPYQKRKTPHGEGRFYVIRAHAFGSFRDGGRP